MPPFTIRVFFDGDLLGLSEHDSREEADKAFDLGVSWTHREGTRSGLDYRVELWEADALLAMFNMATDPARSAL